MQSHQLSELRSLCNGLFSALAHLREHTALATQAPSWKEHLQDMSAVLGRVHNLLRLVESESVTMRHSVVYPDYAVVQVPVQEAARDGTGAPGTSEAPRTRDHPLHLDRAFAAHASNELLRSKLELDISTADEAVLDACDIETLNVIQSRIVEHNMLCKAAVEAFDAAAKEVHADQTARNAGAVVPPCDKAREQFAMAMLLGQSLERENANYAATRVSLREPAQKDTPGFTVHSGRYDSGVAAPEQHKHLEEQQQQQQQQQEGAKQSAATPLLPSGVSMPTPLKPSGIAKPSIPQKSTPLHNRAEEMMLRDALQRQQG